MPVVSRAVRLKVKTDLSDGSKDSDAAFRRIRHRDDEKETTKGMFRFPHRFPALAIILRNDSSQSQTLRVALVLIILNFILLWVPSSTDCVNEVISSFRTWNSYRRRQWTLPPTYRPPSLSDVPSRAHRFPSVERRVQYYMGRWYEPTLQGEPPQSPFGPFWNQQYQTIEADKTSIWDPVRLAYEPLVNPLGMEPSSLYSCSVGESTNKNDHDKTHACQTTMVQESIRDVLDAALLVQEQQRRSFGTRMNHIWYSEGMLGWIMECYMILRRWRRFDYPTPAYLWSIGLGTTKATHQWDVQTPVFSKVRDLVADKDREYHRHQRMDDIAGCALCGPLHTTILWPLERDTLMKKLTKVPLWDICHGKKDETLVWRGDAPADIPILFKLGTDISGIQQRITLVESYANHIFVDAKFIKDDQTDENFPLSYYSEHLLSMGEILQHKYVLAIEGIESSSDLLWMMFSNSVVFLSDTTYTTWAMEDTLEPYVHYIPVHRNMSNVADQVQWAQQHPKRCRDIAFRSTMYVYDLFFHPDAVRDEEYIMRAMIHRYDQYVLKAKPIITWTQIIKKFCTNLKRWWNWLKDDWLRIAFVVIFLLYLLRF